MPGPTLRRATNERLPAGPRREMRGAVVREINAAAAAAGAPADLMLVPAPDDRGVVRGRDGRAFMLPPGGWEEVIAFVAAERPQGICLDENHGTERAANHGLPSHAMGWISANDMYVGEDGALWGKPRWTPGGQRAMADQAYRYISPTLILDIDNKAAKRAGCVGQVVGLSSVGLTNSPNLSVPALNQEQENTMNEQLRRRLRIAQDAPPETVAAARNAALAMCSLEESATDDQILGALDSRMQPPPAPPPTVVQTGMSPDDVKKLVADAVSTAVAAVVARQTPAGPTPTEIALNAILDKAVTDGLVTPASRDLYAKAFNTQEGLVELTNHIVTLKKGLKTEPVTGGPPPKVIVDNAKQVLAVNAADPSMQRMARELMCTIERLSEVRGNVRAPGTGRIEHEYDTVYADQARAGQGRIGVDA